MLTHQPTPTRGPDLLQPAKALLLVARTMRVVGHAQVNSTRSTYTPIAGGRSAALTFSSLDDGTTAIALHK